VTFVEGSQYRNGLGEAVVLHIKDDTMVVRYVLASRSEVFVGQEKEYPVLSQAESVLSERRRQAGEMKRMGVQVLRGENDMFLAGWLAKNGDFGIVLPPKDADKFEGEYEALTGEKPDMELADFCESPWGLGYRVSFPLPPEQFMAAVKLPTGVDVHVSGNTGSITKNDFVRGLLRMGLRMGKNEGRIDAVAAGLRGEDRAAFQEGVEAREKMVA
jgi:hypothetical protein